MLKIGEFAHLSGVSIRLLRYYDEIGLLKPSQIDRWTGYRSYALDQLPRLNRILALKDLGLSLEQIAKLLDEQLPADYIRGMLRLKQAELQQQVEQEQARLRRVEQRLQYIEQEGRMPKYDMVIKRVEAQLVASIREPVASFPEVGRLIDEVMQYVAPYGGLGYDAAIWHDIERPDGSIDAEGLAFIDKPIPANGRISVYELPAIETMAATIHHGSYNNLSQAYAAIMGWIEANGYRMTGSSREIYLEGGGSQDDESFVTEIQFPVEKGLAMPTDLKKEENELMITEPKLEQRDEQHYMGIRTQVPIRKLKNVIPQLLKEVFASLAQHGVTPSGPPFTRFHVIDMAALMDVEIGVPVAAALAGDDKVKAGVLPAGRYASLIYTGVKNGYKSNAALLDWIKKNGLVMDRWDTDKGDAFGSRAEFYITDPADEPNQAKWETEVAIKLADEQSQ